MNNHEKCVLRGEHFFTKSMFPFYIDRYYIDKESHVRSHTHDFIELVYVVEGNAEHKVADQLYRLQSGNVFLLEPEVYHHFTASQNENTTVYNVLFSREFLKEELASLSKIPSFVNFFYLLPFLRKNASFVPYLPLTFIQKIYIEKHLKDIHVEFQTESEGFELIIKTRLLEVLILLSRYHKANQSYEHIFMSDDEAMQSLARFLRQHSSQPITLEQLSETFGISVSSLTSKFKAQTGMTVIEYRQKAQIKNACTQLQSSNQKISTIAFDCGFNDISHFNRLFKKNMGMPPREYSKRMQM